MEAFNLSRCSLAMARSLRFVGERLNATGLEMPLLRLAFRGSLSAVAKEFNFVQSFRGTQFGISNGKKSRVRLRYGSLAKS